MFLTVHAAAAVLISEGITSRVVGFMVGVVSHLLLDMIPHGDKGIDKWVEKNPKYQLLRTMLLALIDIIILFTFTLLAFKYIPISSPEVA